jgi:ferredoxin
MERDMERDNHIDIDKNRCDLCGVCVGVCPENVIRLSPYHLEIEDAGCTRCKKCIWICPVSALSMESAHPEKTTREIL